MRIDVLYFEGCPHHRPTVDLTREVLAELGIEAELHEVEVRDPAEATRLCFRGSPSVRVDGVDIEADAGVRTEFALSCRMYGGSGVPSRELLVAALRQAGAV